MLLAQVVEPQPDVDRATVRIEQDIVGNTIVLSRRNLESLLAKLDGSPPDSACTIMAPTVYGPWLVKAEEDAEHYAHESRKEAAGVAGRMHPDTELAIGAARVPVE